MGIEGNLLKWITEWLRKRQQSVVIHEECSDWEEVTIEVAQGHFLVSSYLRSLSTI
jgi:hypothetical protein